MRGAGTVASGGAVATGTDGPHGKRERADAVASAVRGWTLVYGIAGAVGIAIALVAGGIGAVPWGPALVALGAVVVHAALVLVALPRVLSEQGAPRVATGLAVSTLLLLPLAIACVPWIAMLQFAAYPLLWVIWSRRRTAIVWTALSSVLVLVALAWGGDGDAWERAAIIQATSFAGNIGLGLWFTAVYRHAAETQGLLDRLTAAQDELAALHRDTGVVEERGRLAAELHDTIAQTLAGTVLLVQRSRRELAAGVLADSTLGLVEEAAREALTETRTLVAGGAPVSHGEGLVAALTVLVDRLGRESGLRIDLRADAVTGLDRESEVALLRCAQEGLSNALRHSGARRVEVTLTERDDGVELCIADDGAGFDPAARAEGFGLEGLRARLAHLDGDLLIDGSPGATVLTASVPRSAVRA